MSNFSQVDFFIPVTRNRFDTSAEPVIEDAGAIDSVNRIIADGGQVPDIVDGDPNGRLQPDTDLITGDDSTFDSDTGNWTLGTGITIAGGKMVFTGVAAGVSAEITVPFAFTTYGTSFEIAGLGGGEGIRIEVGDDVGADRVVDDTYTEDLTPTSGTTIKITARGTGIGAGTVDNITAFLKDKFRYDMQLDRRVDVDAMAIVNHNARDVLPTDERDSVKLYWDTDDVFAGSTEVVPTSIIAHQYRADAYTFLDFGGSDTVVAAVGEAGKFRDSFAIRFDIKSSETLAGAGIATMLDGNDDGWRVIFNGGEIWGSVNTIDVKTTSTPIDGTRGIGWFVVDRSTQLGQMYWNGVADGPAVDVSAQILDITTNNMFMGANAEMNLHDLRLYNRAPSAAEILADYTTGVPVDDTTFGTAHQNVSNCEDNNYTTFDGISPTGFHAVWGAGTERGATALEIDVFSGEVQTVTFDLTGATGEKPRVDLRDSKSGTITRSTEGPTFAVDGHNILTFTPTITGTVVVQFFSTATAEYTASNLEVAVSGNVAQYASEGIATAQGSWFDRANGLTGTISGAEGRNNPGNSILFMQFDSINAKYWFAETNPDALTFVGAYKVGQFELLQRFRPNANPDVTGLSETLDQSGIDATTKYGGGMDLNERHDMNTPIDIAYSFFLEDDRAKFKELLRQGKKRVIPYTLNGDAAEPIIKFGRILGNPKIDTVAFGAYTLQFQITEEV